MATVKSLAVKGEYFYRLKRSDWRGSAYFPGTYDSVPVAIAAPDTFGGFCTIQFFDKFGRETRCIGVTLGVESTPVTTEPDSEAGSEAESESQEEPEAEKAEPELEEIVEHSDDPIYRSNLQALLDNTKSGSALSKALVDSSIKRADLDSREHERDVEMRYEQSRAAMILSHSYTKEVAENHQVSNLLRRDLVALAASLRSESQSRVADSDRQIRLTTKLVMDLGKMIREQAAAAPVPPPPPLDVAGLGIALINAVGTIGAAWGPNRPQLPATQTPVQPAATPAAPAPPNVDAALTKEAEEEKELREAIFVAETTGGGDAASLIKLINRLAAKANLIAPGKKS